MHALNTLQCTQRRSGDSWVSEIQLYNLIPVHGPSVSHIDRNRHYAVRSNFGLVHFHIAVGKRWVADSIPERIQRLSVEVTIRSLGHRIVIERRKLLHRLIKRDGKPPRGTENSSKGLCNRRASFAPRVPRFDNSRNLLISPVHCERTSIEQNKHGGLAGAHNLLEKLLLRLRQIDAGTVAARKSVGMDVHLFALYARCKPHGNDD